MTLSTLPNDHAKYQEIAKGFELMMSQLKSYQNESGLWRQVLDETTAWEETSCTAMFAYAFSTGVKVGILNADDYQGSIDRAIEALRLKINEAGELTDVCAGTGQSMEIAYYLDRPRISGDFHGQAPFLWLMAAELSRGTQN